MSRLVDGVLALVVAEAVGLLAWHRTTGRGVAPAPLLANLLAGGCLLVALRSGLKGAKTRVVLPWLGMAGLAHLADLRLRWQS